MRADGLLRVAELVTADGWMQFLDYVAEMMGYYRAAPAVEKLYASQIAYLLDREERMAGIRKNPWDAKQFYYPYEPEDALDEPFRPGERAYYAHHGFFAPSEERGLNDKSTFYKAYRKIRDHKWSLGMGKEVKASTYYHYEVMENFKASGSSELPSLFTNAFEPMVMDTVFNLLNKAGVAAALNQISIGFFPGDHLKPTELKGVSVVDAYGAYTYYGRLEYIRVSTSITDKIVGEFIEVVRNKIHSLRPEWFEMWADPMYHLLYGIATGTIVTLIHELGHRVDVRCLKEESPEIFEFWMEYKDEQPVSNYSKQNAREWWAEHWVAWIIDRIGYSSEIRDRFESILQVEPVEFEPKSYEGFVDDVLAELHKVTSILNKGDHFKMVVEYEKGPSQTLEGRFVGVPPGKKLPTLNYANDEGEIHHFTWFPNRKVKSIMIV